MPRHDNLRGAMWELEEDRDMDPRLPDDIMQLVLLEYLDTFHHDLEAKIVPLLVTNEFCRDFLLPRLYRHVKVGNLRQFSLLALAHVDSLRAMYKLTFLPCPEDPAHEHDFNCTDAEGATTEHTGEALGMHLYTLTDHAMKQASLATRDPRMVLDEVEYLGTFGALQAMMLQTLPARRITYNPQNPYCPGLTIATRNTNQGSLFLRLAPLFNSLHWELDVMWMLVRGLEEMGDLGRVPPRQRFPLLSETLGRYVQEFFKSMGHPDWLRRLKLESYVKVTAHGRPYAFWDRDGDFVDEPKHLLEFVGGRECYGPKLLNDYLVAAVFHELTTFLAKHVPFKWTPLTPDVLGGRDMSKDKCPDGVATKDIKKPRGRGKKGRR